MSKKQASLESFFEKGLRPNDDTAEDSKTANKKKAALKRKYGGGGVKMAAWEDAEFTLPHN